MAYRLIPAMGLLALLGFGGDRLEERALGEVGSISLPARATAVGRGEAWDDDPARLYFRFAHEYGWASMGSGTAYRQVICVSLLAPDAGPADYERWPPRFEPLYADLAKQRQVALGGGRVTISAGRYAQNALDEPAHVYLYADPARRLQIAWHVVDADIAPEVALRLLLRMAASFTMRLDPVEKFAEMRGRGAREADRQAAAIRLARDTLADAGFGAAAPDRPVYSRGVYVEWMDEPEARFQLVRPLGLVRGARPPVVPPRLRDPDGRPRDLVGSVGWRVYLDGEWVTDNRDNAYLPLPGIDRELARRHADETTTLYYFATTVRVEVADDETIRSLGAFFEELPAVEQAWGTGVLVDGERMALPAAPDQTTDAEGGD